MNPRTRRAVLGGAVGLALVGVAGCSALTEDAPSPTATPAYDHLQTTATYVADDVGLALPERVPRVEAAANADLVVLHGDPAVDAEQAVSWLADGRRVGLLGDRAQETWLTWAGSEDYRDTFGSGETSEGEPAPHLLVAGAEETAVTTSRFSWGDRPSNREVVGALEEALGDIAEWSPG